MLLVCIEELRKISSTNEKIEKIKECSEKFGEQWLKVLQYTYDPLKIFYVKKYKKENALMSDKNLNDVFILLDKLDKREITGNEAIKEVEFLRKHLGRNATILDLILQKDLKCGINKKSIQKALGKDLFFEIGYMGAVPYDPKKIDKILDSVFIFSQEKMDGEYSNLVMKDGNINFYSRKNKIQKMPESIINNLQNEIKEIKEEFYFPENMILNGELIIEGYDRYTSNGLLTRIFKWQDYIEKEDKKADEAKEVIEEIGQDKFDNILKKIKYYIWDYQDEKENYFSRLISINSSHNSIFNVSFFEMVETVILINKKKFNEYVEELREIIYSDLIYFSKELYLFDSKEEAKTILMNHFKEIVAREGEGTIVKDGMKPWKDGKPTYQVKLKFEFECELRIKDFKAGTTGSKFENALGAFICESEDGVLKCDPSGIAEDLRFEIWENREDYRNKIITVKCNGLSKTKDGKYSLLHPRFIKFRDDKDEADSFETIKKIHESILK